MKLISSLMICTAVFLLAGCKKAVPDVASASLKEVSLSLGAEEWFNKASVSTGKSVLFADGIPQWQDQRFIPSTRSIVVPVKLAGKYFNNKHLVDKHLVLQKNGEGKITDGHYLYVLGKNKPSLDKHVLQGDLPAFFTGAVVRTYFEGQQVASRNYSNGAETGKGTKITRKEHRDNGSEPQNIIPLSEGCAYVTVDWYWQTFENGVLIYEEFLFSSQEINCEGGTGGGGGEGDNTNCYSNLASFKGNPATESLGTTLIFESEDTKIITYPWVFYKSSIGALSFWGFSSYEQGTHKKDVNGVWKWESLVHQNITKFGVTVGGSVSCTIGSATPQVGIYNAGMELFYTINASIICKGFPIGAEYNYYSKSPKWNIYNPVNPD